MLEVLLYLRFFFYKLAYIAVGVRQDAPTARAGFAFASKSIGISHI